MYGIPHASNGIDIAPSRAQRLSLQSLQRVGLTVPALNADRWLDVLDLRLQWERANEMGGLTPFSRDTR